MNILEIMPSEKIPLMSELITDQPYPPLGIVYDFKEKQWKSSAYINTIDLYKLRVVGMREYDPILMKKDMKEANPYNFNEADLHQTEMDETLTREERMNPIFNSNDVVMMGDDYMLVQDKSYKLYFHYAQVLHDDDRIVYKPQAFAYKIFPSAKFSDYGVHMQTNIVIEKNFNPVIAFPEDKPKYTAYILSANITPSVTMRLSLGSFVGYATQIGNYIL